MTGGPSAGATVAVVVVTFNSRDTLGACLDSLERFVGVPFESVVVDNASHDGSPALAAERGSRIQVIQNPVNGGFARACNQGLRATSAPLVLFLNPDAVVTAGAVEAMAGRLEAEPDVGVVGALTRNSDGTVQVSTGPDLTPATEWRQRRLVLGVQAGTPKAMHEAEARHGVEHEPHWVSGACLMARREAFEAVEGFDEGFFLYEEDADLCRRVRDAGWRVVFIPAAEVRHERGRSMAKDPERARLEYHRSHLLYYRKHNGILDRGFLRLLLFARGLGDLVSRDPTRRAGAPGLLRLALAGS